MQTQLTQLPWLCDLHDFHLQYRANSQHCVKSVHIWSISGPYFFAFELKREIYFVNFRIQPKYGKILTRKCPNTNTLHAVQVVPQSKFEFHVMSGKSVNEGKWIFICKTCAGNCEWHWKIVNLPMRMCFRFQSAKISRFYWTMWLNSIILNRSKLIKTYLGSPSADLKATFSLGITSQLLQRDI